MRSVGGTPMASNPSSDIVTSDWSTLSATYVATTVGLGLVAGVADGDLRPDREALVPREAVSTAPPTSAPRSASEPVTTSGRATAVMAAGSTAVAKSRSPSTWSRAPRTCATCGDPGHLLDLAATELENGCPTGLVTT